MSDLIQTPDSAWESIIEITSKIQSEILSAQSFKDLLLMLRDKGLPIPLTEISIVYKKYGTAKPIFLVSSGEIVSKKDVRSDTDFSADLPAIKDIINNNSNEPVYLETQNACMEKGFPDQYKSLLLIPLKISDIRNIGVFIVHSSSKENAYAHLKNPLAALSKRLAFYLYINFITRRANSFKSFKNELLQTTFHQEHEIIELLLKQLKKWFSIDKINILLIDPFSIDEYFFACKDSEVIQDYRNIKQNLEDTSKLKEIIEYLEQPSELAPTTNYNSWLGAKMAIASDQNVGYILLENNPTEAYTAWERELVSDIAGFAALFLTEFRKNLREKSILTVKDLLLADTLPSDKCLYQTAQDELNKLYGTVPLAIVRINRTTRGLELTDTTIQEFSLDADFIKELANHIETTGKLNINELPIDELKNRLTIDHPKLGRLIAAPMRSGGDELGCFIVPASNCGPLTARYIDDLSDMIATIMDKQGKENLRLDLILEFGNVVAKIKRITKEEIIKITQQYISKAMYSENLYIALYDKQKNEIFFPYIVKDGKPLNLSPRPLNQAKRGKTEEIIITEQPILHKTKQEAQAWYDEPNHEEFLGDVLASWIGVPIITSEGVIGVIATYHSDEEYIYSQGDLFFLQMLALPVSGLFRALTLEEVNQKLHNAQNMIVEREKQMVQYSLIQDIQHRLNNSLGSIAANIDESLYDLDSYTTSKNIKELTFCKKLLSNSKETINILIKDTQLKKELKPEKININYLLSNIIDNLSLEKRLDKSIFKVSIAKDSHYLLSLQNNIYNLLYILLDNAVDAVYSVNLTLENEKNIIISIYQKNNEMIIEIKDNGTPIPKGINIFSLGQSTKNDGGGYGLWRAELITTALGGSISVQELDSWKIFTVTIPIFTEKNKMQKIAIIIEDEVSWRDLIEKWLKSMGYETKVANSKKQALEMMSNLSVPPVLFSVDVSLDNTSNNNVDGLSLVKLIKESYGDAKIVLTTSHRDKVEFYEDQVDRIIEKISSVERKPINRKSFTDNILSVMGE